jgi:tetratricopeptide (TPR) repeat protein
MWGRVIDQPNVDLLAVTEMIARDVAQGIVGRLLPRERAALSLRLTASPEAYEHLARGNYFLAQRSARSAGRAIQEYQWAVRLDSAFAAAHARLALAYVLAVINRLDVGLSQDSLMARFHDAINHARARDSLSADVVLATALTGDLSDAPLEQAVQRDSDNAELQHMRGLQLAVQGDLIGGTAALHQAVAIDPDRPITLGWLSVLAIARRRFAEAKRWADSALALNPGFPGYAHRALVNLQLGDTVQARADAEAALRVSSGRGVGTASMALIQAATGDTAGAHVRIEELLGAPAAAAPNDEAWAYTIATLGLLGDTARAFDLLNGMTVLRYLNGTTVLRYVRLLLPLAVFDPLRNQPRFVRAIDASLPRLPK